jgi:hypothetical protein
LFSIGFESFVESNYTVRRRSIEGESEKDLRWYALYSEFGYVLEPKPPVVVWMTHNAATCSIEFLQLG